MSGLSSDVRYLMVTADDLGYAPERDAGIIRGFTQGCITQASLLVTGPSAESAVKLAAGATRRAEPAAFSDQVPSSSSSSSSAASPAPVYTQPSFTTFRPHETSSCRTLSEFRQVRREFQQEFGLQKFQEEMIQAGWFSTTEKPELHDVSIATAEKPFNPFARLVDQKMAAPYGNLLQQHNLSEWDKKYFVACNRPELDQQWASDAPEWIGKASMSQRHQFLLVKDLHWSTFNVLTFGMISPNVPHSKEAQSSALHKAVQTIDEIERVARKYTKAAGWSDNCGFYFHCFPFNSVHSLHLHMLDLSVTGPTFDYLSYKNMPLSVVRQGLLEELQEIDPIAAAKLTVKSTPSSSPTSPSHSSSASPSFSIPATGLPLGLHFNLTEGVCIHDGQTFMLGKEGFWAACRAKSILREFVELELHAQIKRFVALTGRMPEYVDGHNHIHVIPVIAEVLAHVLPKYHISRIRCPIESLPAPPSPSPAVAPADAHSSDVTTPTQAPFQTVLPITQRNFFVEIINHARQARILWQAAGLKTSDHFIGLQLMGRNNGTKRFVYELEQLQPGTTELMCHPGYPSTIGDDFSRSADRAHELEVLCDQDVWHALHKHRIKLVAWRDV